MQVINPVAHSDAEIITAFRDNARKETAFTWLVLRDQQKIYWFIRRMVIDHDDANDLVQDVFIKAWGGLQNFRGDSSILHWLYRISVNHCITFLEQKKKKHNWVALEDAEHELRNKLHSGKLMNSNQIELKLQEAILSLPEKQRLVFELRYYDEIPFKELSSILETSEGALKASYHHAAKKVEAYLKKDDD